MARSKVLSSDKEESDEEQHQRDPIQTLIENGTEHSKPERASISKCVVARESTRMSPELLLGLQEIVTELKLLVLLLYRNRGGLLLFDFNKQTQKNFKQLKLHF